MQWLYTLLQSKVGGGSPPIILHILWDLYMEVSPDGVWKHWKQCHTRGGWDVSAPLGPPAHLWWDTIRMDASMRCTNCSPTWSGPVRVTITGGTRPS